MTLDTLICTQPVIIVGSIHHQKYSQRDVSRENFIAMLKVFQDKIAPKDFSSFFQVTALSIYQFWSSKFAQFHSTEASKALLEIEYFLH